MNCLVDDFLTRFFRPILDLQLISIGYNLFQEIPAAGIDEWFKLKGRSSKSHVDGHCHLKITLTTGKVTYRGPVISLQGWQIVRSKDLKLKSRKHSHKLKIITELRTDSVFPLFHFGFLCSICFHFNQF